MRKGERERERARLHILPHKYSTMTTEKLHIYVTQKKIHFKEKQLLE